MKRIVAIILTVAFTLVCFVGCGERTNTKDLMRDIEPTDLEEKSVGALQEEAVCDFALRLFAKCNKEGENVLISPLSVLYALALTANGADGKTLEQMESVIGMPIGEANKSLGAYMSRIPNGEKYKLSIANSIWFRDDIDVNLSFLQLNADYYGADAFMAPFDASTLKDINKWTSDNTDGMIQELLDKIPDEAVMYLVNAIAFDSEWERAYTEKQVWKETFYSYNGDECAVDFMHGNESVYIEDDLATGFIKYYKDKKYAFAALVPNEGVSISDYIDSMEAGDLYSVLRSGQTKNLSVSIPKFEYEYSADMKEILKALGMTDAFDGERADFSGIGIGDGTGVFINRVLHKTYISVNEQGSRAGAASSVEETLGSPPEIKNIKLDRPFIFAIVETNNSIPVFIGAVNNVK